MQRSNRAKPDGRNIRSQLSALSSDIRTVKRRTLEDPLPSLQNWHGDDVDHLNINRSSVSNLARFLSLEFYGTFRHRIFEKFTSLNAFWVYITDPNKDDRVREMDSASLRRFRRKNQLRDTRNLRLIIADTAFHRVKDNREIKKAMVESTLPFDMYYMAEGSGLRIRNRNAHWLILMNEEIRDALKEDREPDFSFLQTYRTDNPYSDVLPKNYALELNVQVEKRPKKRRSVETPLVPQPDLTKEPAVQEPDAPTTSEPVSDPAPADAPSTQPVSQEAQELAEEQAHVAQA